MADLMAEQVSLVPRPECRAPELNRLIPAYCFGRLDEVDGMDAAGRARLEAHLRECEVCGRAAARLGAAVNELESDRSLLTTLDLSEAAGALGISGRFALGWGGHFYCN
jgi:hypothetical protein